MSRTNRSAMSSYLLGSFAIPIIRYALIPQGKQSAYKEKIYLAWPITRPNSVFIHILPHPQNSNRV